MMQAVEINDLTANNGNFSLKNLTTNIPKGKITAIVGPNGSGKSTLLNLIAQLLPKQQGEISILSKATQTYKTKELARTISMLPQSKTGMPNLTVRELVTLGRTPYQSTFSNKITKQDLEIVDWAMEQTGTFPFGNRLFHSLSGGEQQRARIALALAQKTSVLLLDEPTTYLDIAHQLEIMRLVKKLNQKFEMTIIMVLHELQQAAMYCDFLIAMKRGTIITSGQPREILSSDFLKKIYDIHAKVLYIDQYPLIIPIND